MSRETCYRCFWPKPLCWCSSIVPMETRTHFVFLMHPKEFKQEKAATGRLTHLCLASSEIHVGTGFDDHEPVQALMRDPKNHAMLLYPGENARNLSAGELVAADIGERRLVVFLLDATWSCARKMLRLSPTLQQLPRLTFSTARRSRYVIKQQPQPECLSTLEATHELLVALERAGLDRYRNPDQLIALFDRMQDFQIRCATDPNRSGYRRQPYSDPATRLVSHGESAKRRRYVRAAPAAPINPTPDQR